MTLENYFNRLNLERGPTKTNSPLLPVVSSDNNDSVCQLYINNAQNDVLRGSKMTVPVLSGIIQEIEGIETDFRQIEYGQEDLPDKVFKEVKQGFTRNMNLITKKGITVNNQSELSDGFDELLSHNNREASIRTLIDQLLFPILKELGLKILVEEGLQFQGLPTNKLDYLIVNQNKQAIGLIEAKDAGEMKKKSLAQTLSQLISLQKLNGAQTIFGVVTDAKNYYVMKLSGTTIILDSEEEDGEMTLRITTVKGWDDLKNVTEMLYNLLKEGRDSLNNNNSDNVSDSISTLLKEDSDSLNDNSDSVSDSISTLRKEDSDSLNDNSDSVSDSK